MAQGNGHSSHPPGSGDQAPPDHPLADTTFDFPVFLETIKLTFERFKESPASTVLLWACVLWAVWASMMGGLTAMSSWAPSAIEFILGCLSILVGCVEFALTPIVTILFLGIQAVLYKPVAQRMFDRSASVGSPRSLVTSNLGTMLKAIITILPMVLFMCCPPLGLLASLAFGQAPYLVVVHNQGIVEAFKTSLERAKTHWHVLVMAMGLMFGALCVAAVVAVPLAVVAFVAGFISDAFYALLSPFYYIIPGFIAAVAGFVISAAAFVTIDELEGLATIDDPLDE